MTSSERLLTLTKAFALIVCLLIVFTSCAGGYDDTSLESAFEYSEDESEYSEPEFEGYNRDEIAQLLKNDEFVHSVFVGGYFSGGKYTDDYAKADYAYQALLDIIKATYSKDSGMLDYCITMPDYGDDAIRCGVDGNIEYYYHYINTNVIDVTSFHVTEKAVICGGIMVPICVESNGLRLGGSLFTGNEYNLEYPVGTYMNAGTADKIGGRMLALILMLSDGDDVITDDEMAEYEQNIYSALDSVTQLVTDAGYDISIDKKIVKFTHSGDSIGKSAYANALDMALAATTFHSLDGLVAANANPYEYNSYFVIVCLNTVEGCTAIPYYQDMADTFACERIMCGKYLIDTDAEEAVLRLYGAQADRDSLLIDYIGTDVLSGGSGIGIINQYRLGLSESLHRQLCKFIS